MMSDRFPRTNGPDSHELYVEAVESKYGSESPAASSLAATAGSAIQKLNQDALEHGCVLPEDALKYAQRLATWMWEKHWKADAPNWEPYDDIIGVLTQIDNMVSGMTRK